MSKRKERKEKAKKAAKFGIPIVGIFAGLGKIFSRRRAKRQAQKEGKMQNVEQTSRMKAKSKRQGLI